MGVLGVLFTPLVIPLMTIVVVLAAVHYYQQQQRLMKMGAKLPGPAPLPLIGNAHMILGLTPHEIMNFALDLGNVYGNVARAVG